MSRNIKILLIVSIIIGASVGIYEFILPYYLKEQGVSFEKMGYIFSISTVAMFIVRIVSGKLADTWGRKRVYVIGVLSCALATLLTPFTASMLLLILLKTTRDVGILMRDTVHPILIYEENRSKFMNFIGKTRGMEFLFQATGTTIAGASFIVLGTGRNLWLAGILVFIALMFLALGLHVKPIEEKENTIKRTFLSLNLPRNLIIIMFANFIFSIGLSISHSFIMPLFFSEKFKISEGVVSIVMVIHRITIALPMLVIGNLKIKRLKAFYIGSVFIQGIVTSVSALIPNFIVASAVWLLHDFVGAGVWGPIQSTIIQQSCRDESRGSDMSKTIAFSALGGAIGPTLAGYLSNISISAPFFMSGLLIILSTPILFGISIKTENC
ncbi:MAG: MFS transporter [bacterium]